MVHLSPLIVDLCLILASGGLVTLIFKKIKQPLVLGYIIAGILVGPHISLLPTVTEDHSIRIWAEIGVIFLLFTLGLEFNFKKLTTVGAPASITAIVEVLFMISLGFITGILLGWSRMDSIFLGGILSISSTTIIIRAFTEAGIKTQRFATLVFGVLIVEDLVAILLLVLLSTLAVSRQFSGSEMLFSASKLGFFLVLWFVAGTFIIPTFFKRTAKLMTDEILLIVSIALCLLMVLLATKVGFSPALGAFIMGSLLSETIHGDKIEHLVKSVKDLFGAIFFVSVGMLINPQMIVNHIGPVLIISIITITGKIFSTSAGSLISGQTFKTSVRSGMSLAQIGEFSFIIATLGLTLKVTSDFLYPIAVAVSAITTFTTPYLIKHSESAYTFIENALPKKWITNLNRYSSSTQVLTTTGNWKKIIKYYIYYFVIHSAIIIAIILITKSLESGTHQFIQNIQTRKVLTLSLGIILLSPFIWAISIRRINAEEYYVLLNNKEHSRGPFLTIDILRVSLGILFSGILFFQFFQEIIPIIISYATMMGLIFYLNKKLPSVYNSIEQQFLSNLKHGRRTEKERFQSDIVPWDAHLVELKVSPESLLIGKSLAEVAIREKYGVSIALIERGNSIITIPGKDEKLYPGDQVQVIGTDEQLEILKTLLEVPSSHHSEGLTMKEHFVLQKIHVNSDSPLCSLTIRSSNLREATKSMIVGIERNGLRILNPDSSTTFRDNDIVWIVGNPKRIAAFFNLRKSDNLI